VYLASLKGVPEKEARIRLGKYLDRFDLAEHKGKKVKELSKGMQQKAQIINSLLHQPEVVIIDEPFAGLDPLNVQMVKDLMNELREQGVTIIMSTHQMHLVEELCDRILLIDKGQDMLYGNLNEIQKSFYGHAVLVRTQEELPTIKGVREVRQHNNAVKLILNDSTTPQEILNVLTSKKIIIEKFEIAMPSLDEIFIRVVEGGKQNE
jgi:ABC-2 type transport system ATP-binding protein